MAAPESKRNFSAVQLTPGKSYRVIAEFRDYDGRSHPVGETWTYTGHEFLPYEDGLTMRILQNEAKSFIRLQWREEAQGDIIRNFSDFVEEM